MSYYVYLLASQSGTLYIGMTNNLERRIYEHKVGNGSVFTKRYGIKKLLHYEEYQSVSDAIAREKQIKGWRRSRKIELFQENNPGWKDLAKEWFEIE